MLECQDLTDRQRVRADARSPFAVASLFGPSIPAMNSPLFTFSHYAFLFVLALNLALPSVYTQGGKAIPLRIQFQSGRNSATLSGRLRSGEQTDYAAAAKKNQTLVLTLDATPAGSITLRAIDPDRANLALKVESRRQWSAVLPKDGDYEIWVMRASDKRGASRYTLTVTIK